MAEYPTGRKRHRVEEGKLILQLEIEEYSQTGFMADNRKCSWRDATVEDVTLVDNRQKTESPL